MAIHFSIGFVVEARPKKPVVSQCAEILEASRIDAVWPRDDGMSCMGGKYCGCVSCISGGFICAPKGDDVMIIFSVYDTDGDEFDIRGATEIVFIVADHKGSEVRIVKKLSLGQVQISTNGFQFSVTLSDDDTSDLVVVKNYYEAQLTTSAGLKKTVSAGILRADNTMIKDLP